MKKILAPLAALAAGFALSACATKPTEVAPSKLADDVKPDVKKAPPTDLEQLAQRLVAQSAGVKEGEIVLVGGGPQDLELLEDIAVQVRKAGAFPLVTVNTDRLAKRMYTDVPDKYDSQPDALDMKLAEIANVSINVDSNTTEGLLADADPKRMAARAKVGEDVGEAFLKHNVRTVDVGNGLYPTDWRAKRYGMSADDLAKTFWGGVNVDYADLQTRGEQVSTRFGQ